VGFGDSGNDANILRILPDQGRELANSAATISALSICAGEGHAALLKQGAV
jgi:hypothetical protein